MVPAPDGHNFRAEIVSRLWTFWLELDHGLELPCAMFGRVCELYRRVEQVR